MPDLHGRGEYRDLIVAKMAPAVALLAQASSATEAKEVADLAAAGKVFAERQRLGREAVAYANSIVVDALAKMGDFLLNAVKNEGGRPANETPTGEERVSPPTCAEIGISYRESSESQALATLREKAPERYEQARKGLVPVSSAVRDGRRFRALEAPLAARPAVPDGPSSGDRRWELVLSDCLAGMAARPGGVARMVFADPPYNEALDYGPGAAADRRPDAEYLSWCERWLAECVRLLTPDGSLWLLVSWPYACEQGVTLKRLGLTIRNVVVWHEGFGTQTERKFARCSRPLFYAVKDARNFVFDDAAARVPSDRQTKYGDTRADPRGKVMGDVWSDIPRLAGTHAERLPGLPTQLPVALVERVVRVATAPGDLIADPFAGGATAGVAALRLGRRYLGFERQPRFHEIATLRLKGETS